MTRPRSSQFPYWKSFEDMAHFTGADPGDIHHLPRDAEFLVELLRAVQILRLRSVHGRTG